MELKEARYILSIADNKSISKAAKELFISQPSLSKYLKNLEDRLGSCLFSRLDGEYIPTHLGERYLYYAREIMALESQWSNEYNDTMHLNGGRFKIAMPIMRSTCLLPKTLPAFHKKYPHVQIQLLEDVYFVAEHMIEDNSIDLIFINKNKLPNALDCDLLGQEEIVLIVSKDNPLSAMGVPREGCRYPWIDLRLCAKENFILLFPDQNTGEIALELFDEAGIRPPILFHTRNSQVSIEFALENMGVAFAPESYYHYVDHDRKGVCLSIGNPAVTTTLFAAHKKGKYLPRYAYDFMNIIREYYANKFQ